MYSPAWLSVSRYLILALLFLFPINVAEATTTGVVHSSFVKTELQNTPRTILTDCCAVHYASLSLETRKDLSSFGEPDLPEVTRKVSNFELKEQSGYLNDGNYDNDAPRVADTVRSWLKIDFGQTIRFNRVTLIRKSAKTSILQPIPGRFTVQAAKLDDVYAAGNDENDENEYSTVLDSTDFMNFGMSSAGSAVQSDFNLVTARYLKINISGNNSDVGIDDLEVFKTSETETFALFSVGRTGIILKLTKNETP